MRRTLSLGADRRTYEVDRRQRVKLSTYTCQIQTRLRRLHKCSVRRSEVDNRLPSTKFTFPPFIPTGKYKQMTLSRPLVYHLPTQGNY